MDDEPPVFRMVDRRSDRELSRRTRKGMKTGKWCFCPACVNQRPALEALLDASMFEEKLGMQAQSMFANIEDDQYNQLYDVRAHGTERLSLNIGIVPHRLATIAGLKGIGVSKG